MNSRNSSKLYHNFCILIIIIMIVLIPVQIVLFILYPHPSTITEWFTLFKINPIIGFIGFDVIYAFSNVLMIFLYISLFIIIKKCILFQENTLNQLVKCKSYRLLLQVSYF